MSSRHQRAKRRARRQGAAGQPTGAPLVPHTPRCPCAACEEGRKDQVKRGITQTHKRLRDYSSGHAQPEHRDEWRISGHRLVEFFATHEAYRDRRAHLTRVEMREEFISHLDWQVGEQELCAARLYEALLVLGSVEALGGPLRARIIRACTIEGLSQDEVAVREHMTQPSVSRNLDAGLASLLEIYGGLLLVEQHSAAS